MLKVYFYIFLEVWSERTGKLKRRRRRQTKRLRPRRWRNRPRMKKKPGIGERRVLMMRAFIGVPIAASVMRAKGLRLAKWLACNSGLAAKLIGLQLHIIPSGCRHFDPRLCDNTHPLKVKSAYKCLMSCALPPGSFKQKATSGLSNPWSRSSITRWLREGLLAFILCSYLGSAAEARIVDLQKLVKRICELNHDMIPQLGVAYSAIRFSETSYT